MAIIDEKYLNQLRASGLHVSHPIPAFLDGVWVCKPCSTPGNHISGYKGGYISLGDEPECPETDAPMLKFIFDKGVWQVDGHLSAGGTGPSDFVDNWGTAEEAVKDILAYYFGDPARMQKKAAEREEIRLRCEALKKKKNEPPQNSP